ncbi:MAG: SDR family oxidoreductase [Bacillota bacterium]|nr:SDR family oxidoreductase [Bacillota bacterium]
MSAINIANRKTVLITGSSKGIGKAIALRFAKEGYNLVINGSKDKEKLEETKAEIEKFNVACLAFLGDMGDYHKVKELFKLIKEEFGHLDVLVNNAGISYVGLLSDMTWQDWDKVIRTNLTSVYNCCSLAIPNMVQKKEGKIINISSVWGNVGASCEVAYSASKGGMNAFTKALAKELAPSNIKVNAIACGAIDTEMNSFLSEEELYQLKEEIPMGRLGRSDEVADLVYYLAEKNEYLTGQVIGLDGGWI